MNAQIITIANQKGGVGKATTCSNLGIGLVQAGKKMLLIDGDPQGSLTISLGYPQTNKLPVTLSDTMERVFDQCIRPGESILHHAEGVDLMLSDIQLSGMNLWQSKKFVTTKAIRETEKFTERLKRRDGHLEKPRKILSLPIQKKM